MEKGEEEREILDAQSLLSYVDYWHHIQSDPSHALGLMPNDPELIISSDDPGMRESVEPIKRLVIFLCEAAQGKAADVLLQQIRDSIITRLQAGDPEAFFFFLDLAPVLLGDPEVFALTIATWWPLKFQRSEAGERARSYLRRIGSVLCDPHGATELPEEQAGQNRRKSDLQVKHDRRALCYYDSAWNDFLEQAQERERQGMAAEPILRRVAANVAKEHFSRQTSPMRTACDFFWDKVEQYLIAWQLR
jgi:hypothetical protein